MKYQLNNAAYKQWYQPRFGVWFFENATRVIGTGNTKVIESERNIEVRIEGSASLGAYVPERFLTPLAEGE